MKAYTTVTAVMVTGKDESRIKLAHRAIHAWQKQSYLGRRELLIVNDHPDLAVFPDGPPAGIREFRVAERLSLGALRNIGIEQAAYDYLVQWDDDDYAHHNRLMWQMEHTPGGMASTLRFEIHYDSTDGQSFVNDGQSIRGCGFPGTMLWPRTMATRFPEIGRREDMDFIQAIKQAGNLKVLENDPLLYIRFYHGNNTWEQTHVMNRKRGWRELSPFEQHYLESIVKQDLDQEHAATV